MDRLKMNEELAACPFCGCKIIDILYPNNGFYEVRCSNCGASVKHQYMNTCCYKWNARVLPPWIEMPPEIEKWINE